MLTTRPAGQQDLPLLWEMLRAAVAWSGADVDDAVLRDPHVRHYVAGWPGPGDLGVIALDRAPADGPPDAQADDARGAGPAAPPGEELGAGWLRHLTAEDPGYGFVRDGVPELSMGVRDGHRGRGVGTRILLDLLAAARAAGIPAVSLSVEDGNDVARRLYRRHGFAVVGRSGGSDVMLLDLAG